jgi:hypothetical protein
VRRRLAGSCGSSSNKSVRSCISEHRDKTNHPNAIAVESTGFGVDSEPQLRSNRGAMIHLFDNELSPRSREELEPGAVLLRGFATSEGRALLEEVERIAQASPFRRSAATRCLSR